MKQNNHLTLKIALLVGLVVMGLPTTSKAQFIVYADSFNQRTGSSIDLQQVQSSPNAGATYGGTANALWNVNSGDVKYAMNKDQANMPTGSADNATLSFSPKATFVYQLTATLAPVTGTAVDLGFYNNSAVGQVYLDDSIDNGVTLYSGESSTLVKNSGVTGKLTLVLDMTDDMVYVENASGNQIGGSLTFLPSSITQVGFDSANGSNLTHVAAFQLAALQAVPEPSSYVSGLIVLGFLAFEIRRRRMAVQS